MRLSFRAVTGLLVLVAVCGLLTVFRYASRTVPAASPADAVPGAALDAPARPRGGPDQGAPPEAAKEVAGESPGGQAAAPQGAAEVGAQPAEPPPGADDAPRRGGAAVSATGQHGTWRGAAVLPVPTFTKSKKPLFYLKHLTKAGGTFGQFLVQTVVAPSHWRVNADDGELRLHEKKSHFIVITMRNPCDLYVSFANFCPRKAFFYGGPTRGPDPLKDSADTANLPDEVFEAWFRNSQRMDGTGFYSFYFWQKIINPRCRDWYKRRSKNDPDTQDGAKDGPHRCDNLTRMSDELATWSPKQMAHCWVFQETMMDDYRECLAAYELSTEYAKGAVDWDLFEKMAANRSFADELYGKFDNYGGAAKLLSDQGKRHKPCREYWATQEMQDAVRLSDGGLFEKLGYHACCTRSDHNLQ